MIAPRSAKKTALGGALGVVAAAAVLVACTITQSLDYLQKGDGAADALSESPNAGDGGDGGTRVPTVLVPDQTKPGFLAQDATALYWIAAGTVFSVPKSGGMAKALAAVPPNVTSLAADPNPDGAVFVAIGTDVTRIPKDGSDAGVVFKGTGGLPADTVAANDVSLYVLQYDPNGIDVGSRILRMTKTGTGSLDIAPDAGPSTLSLDPNDVLWLNSDIDKPAFVEQPKAAAPGTMTKVYDLAADDNLPLASADIAVDDGFVFWIADDATSGAATIYARKRDAAGTTIAIYRGPPEDTFAHLVVDDVFAYVIDTRTSALLRVPKTGGDAETVLAGLNAPSGLVVDASAIYLTVEATASNGQVLKLAK
ncbi:MAG: putative serine/threonine-protein kinase pknH [Labilithrix sp.]|nr:putative serine/threonine-protein kinase pknH [Labilithrix sp.]